MGETELIVEAVLVAFHVVMSLHTNSNDTLDTGLEESVDDTLLQFRVVLVKGIESTVTATYGKTCIDVVCRAKHKTAIVGHITSSLVGIGKIIIHPIQGFQCLLVCQLILTYITGNGIHYNAVSCCTCRIAHDCNKHSKTE